MIRKAFMMEIYPGQQEEYKKRHNPIWLELQDILKTQGVSNYSIFLNPATNQLFAYVELESEEKWKKIADTAVNKKWWKYMKEIMPSNPNNSPISVELEEVFHID